MLENKNENINIFKECVKKQCLIHTAMQPRDVVKLCFQAAFGAEHLLSDMEAAWSFFEKEYERTESAGMPLWEQISGQIFRVNLAAWKQRALPKEWLFRMFAATANITATTEKPLLDDYLKAAEEVLFAEVICGFSREEWCVYLNDYCSRKPEPVHHSDAYRVKEQPAYRIVKEEFVRVIPILERIIEMKDQHIKHPFVITIDGRAAAGKSTLAAALKEILQVSVIHMDDFFLPMELRSEERFREPGGNVHYERFKEEVLPYLHSEKPFSYQKFDCSCMDYNGRVSIEAGEWRIVEGSYSMHPVFGAYADLTIFCDVEPGEQMDRIEKRNGTWMAEMFRTRWIPLEEAYFSAFAIKEKAGHVMMTEAFVEP